MTDSVLVTQLKHIYWMKDLAILNFKPLFLHCANKVTVWICGGGKLGPKIELLNPTICLQQNWQNPTWCGNSYCLMLSSQWKVSSGGLSFKIMDPRLEGNYATCPIPGAWQLGFIKYNLCSLPQTHVSIPNLDSLPAQLKYFLKVSYFNGGVSYVSQVSWDFYHALSLLS